MSISLEFVIKYAGNQTGDFAIAKKPFSYVPGYLKRFSFLGPTISCDHTYALLAHLISN